jgi:hypothetical protein
MRFTYFLIVVQPKNILSRCGVRNIKIFLNDEPVAKLALETEFDDFGVGSIFGKAAYLTEHRCLAKNRTQRQKREFRPKWSFATGSLICNIGKAEEILPCLFSCLAGDERNRFRKGDFFRTDPNAVLCVTASLDSFLIQNGAQPDRFF